jgi:hypothetical protein
MSNQLNHYYRKRQELIAMLGGKCAKCGCTEDLEFDHIDRDKKSFDIGANYSRKIEDLLEELAKCQLLCADHHLEKTRELDGLKMEHGKLSMYRHAKCRCDLCKGAQADYMREWRRKNGRKKK